LTRVSALESHASVQGLARRDAASIRVNEVKKTSEPISKILPIERLPDPTVLLLIQLCIRHLHLELRLSMARAGFVFLLRFAKFVPMKRKIQSIRTGYRMKLVHSSMPAGARLNKCVKSTAGKPGKKSAPRSFSRQGWLII
jgi:hypothetical protein